MRSPFYLQNQRFIYSTFLLIGGYLSFVIAGTEKAVRHPKKDGALLFKLKIGDDLQHY